uniref:ATP-dependent Clp protease proteolytic subunit n=1 Tax=Leptocodon hirsutus TaxID=1334537 RepID=A0A6M8Q139_9ASTR|nr:ATP-dependent protease proteolytic subunit [Leptocodon hirsutus]QKI32188.1 ATP-dependent protease proteolytic subunit [Leptocodon hirsutus]
MMKKMKKKMKRKKKKKKKSGLTYSDRLYRARTLFLFQELTAELTANLTGLMAVLNIEDNTLEQFLFINSTGGKIVNGLAVYDMSQGIIPDVHTLCLGLAASIASLILSGGALTKRIAFPNAWRLIHQPKAKIEGNPLNKLADAELDIDEVLQLRKTVLEYYARISPSPVWVIAEDMERDTFMTPTEAQAYGLIDDIGTDISI